MTVLPVVSRELLVQARRKSTYWMRVAASAVAGFLMLWLLVVGSAQVSTSGQGKTLFSVLSILAFIYCLLIGAFVTADCLSAEKRDGTLGLIFLTDLKGHDVVLGKLVSSSIHAVYGLLAAVPMMSLTLLLGGVTAGEVARTTLVLANTLFFSLSAGMFVSTLSQNDRKAIFAALLLVVTVSAGPFGLGFFLANHFGGGTPFGDIEPVLSPSPIFAFAIAQSSFVGTLRASALYSSLAQTHAIAWLLLGLACGIVPHVWKDRPRGRRRERWSQRFRRWTMGGEAARVAFRRRLLDRNPCFWLSSRERYKAACVWVLVVSLAAVGVGVYVKYGTLFYEASLLLLLTLQVLLKVWFAGETCNRWIEDRRGNALELLVCAPLKVQEMIGGQGMALRRQFGGPVMVTLVLTLVVWATVARETGLWGNPDEAGKWLLMSAPVLIADLIALRWVGMWLGLTARGLSRAIAGTLGRVLWLRWLVYLLGVGVAIGWAWIGFRPLRFLSSAWFWFVAALTLDLVFGWAARHRFLKHFRTIASNPSDYRSAIRMEAAATGAEAVHLSGSRTRRTRIEAWWSKRRVKRATVAAAVLLLIGGIPVGYRYSLSRRVGNRIHRIQQAGFPISVGELDRQRPPLTNDVNAAEVIERAFPLITMRMRFPQSVQKNLPAWGRESWDRSEPLALVMKDAITSVLSSNQAALAIIHEVPSLSAGRYVIDSRSAGARYSAQFQGLLQLSDLLQLEVILRADEGDVSGAIDSLRRLFELGRSLNGDKPGQAFQYMRRVCWARAFVAMEWLLSRRALPEPALNSLRKELGEPEATLDLQWMLIGLRCLALDFYRSPPDPMTLGGPGTRPTGEMLRIQIQSNIRKWTGADDRELAAFLDAIDDFLRLLQAPWPERLQKAGRRAAAKPAEITFAGPGTLLNPKYVFDSVICAGAEFEARRQAALTCLAIEQFRLRHAGELPESLVNLVPEFISEVPRDPFDGQAIRYKRLLRGYCVYSVGKNGKDDGGTGSGPALTRAAQVAGDDIAFSVER